MSEPAGSGLEAAAPGEPADLTIDLDGAGSSPGPTWRLVQGDGRPLGAPLPYARDWSRAGRPAMALLVDDGGRVLQSAALAAAAGKSYGRMLDEVLAAAAHLPALAWREAQGGSGAGAAPATPDTARGAPWLALAGGGLRWIGRRLADAVVVELWRVGVADRPIGSFVDDPDVAAVRWLTEDESSAYCADPFANPQDADEIWWERYDYRTGLGTLERCRLGAGVAPVELDVSCHLSFPHLAEMDGEVVLIPEACGSGTTRLYRVGADRQPRCIAVLPVAGVDPVTFRWGDRHWIAVTDGKLSDNANLCLWHAPAAAGPWTPHRNNPVKLDVRSSRNAGTPFWHGGALYRPAMDCSRTYGGQVVLHRIVDCSPTGYREEAVAIVRPDPCWPVPDGLHTLSKCGERTLIDAKVREFRLRGFAAKAMRRLRPPSWWQRPVAPPPRAKRPVRLQE